VALRPDRDETFPGQAGNDLGGLGLGPAERGGCVGQRHDQAARGKLLECVARDAVAVNDTVRAGADGSGLAGHIRGLRVPVDMMPPKA
jgi:hypothetical protein